MIWQKLNLRYISYIWRKVFIVTATAAMARTICERGEISSVNSLRTVIHRFNPITQCLALSWEMQAGSQANFINFNRLSPSNLVGTIFLKNKRFLVNLIGYFNISARIKRKFRIFYSLIFRGYCNLIENMENVNIIGVCDLSDFLLFLDYAFLNNFLNIILIILIILLYY